MFLVILMNIKIIVLLNCTDVWAHGLQSLNKLITIKITRSQFIENNDSLYNCFFNVNNSCY